MIAINCTNCRHRLEMDDAFAGGVCRCQYCGTIQTVPSRGGGKGRPATPGSGSSSSASKSLYKKEGAAAATGSSSTSSRGTRKSATAGTGLDELAQVVASSGLARGSLKRKPPAAPPPPKDAETEEAGGASRFPVVPVAIGGGVFAVIVVALLIYLAMRPSAPAPSPSAAGGAGSTAAPNVTPPPDSGNATPEQPPAAKISGPAFADVPLPSGTVIYLVDRSQANDEILDPLKQLVYKSARSLGPSRTFQIIFWDRANEGIVAYPEKKLALASEKQVNSAIKRFEDVVSYGTTELKPTLERALKLNPQVIVIASAKGFSLEESNAAMVKSLMKGKSVQIHTFAIGETGSATLKQIATQNGGEYRQITPQQLRELAK
jgi:hypothetical protein